MPEKTRVTIAGSDYVIVDEATFERLLEATEDAGDLAHARRVEARIAAGEEEAVPAEVVNSLLAGDNPIRVWRRHRGLTIDELARRANISRAYLSQLETGKREGKLSTIAALAGALDLDIGELAEDLATASKSA